MSYLVLARKWRPQYFEEVTGQEHVTRTLLNAFEQGRLHHAFLFTGARGVGKTSCARILAKALNCHRGPCPRPCYDCPSCKEITEGGSVDVFEIDGASNRGIDEIRNLREGVKYAPHRDRFKIYIIDEVHMLTEQAFNALLKTVEEPPGHVKFILATTEPQKIPATILSRCQRFDFKRIPPRRLVGRLQEILAAEGFRVEEEGLALIAREAEGSFRDALSLLDQVISYSGGNASVEDVVAILGLMDRRNLQEVVAHLVGGDLAAALEVLDRVHTHGYDLTQFTLEILRYFRDLAVLTTCGEVRGLVDLPEAEVATLREVAGRTSPERVERLFATLARTAEEIARSPFPKLLLEMTFLRMSRLAPPVPVDRLVERLEALEGRLEILGGPAPGSPAAAPAVGGPPGSAVPGPRDVRTATDVPLSAPAPPAEGPAPPPGPGASGQTPAAPVEFRPPPSPEATSEAPRKWETLVAEVRSSLPLLAALLEQARPLFLGPDRIRLAFDDPAGIVASQVKESLADLTRLWSRLQGRPVEVQLAASATADPALPPSLQEIGKRRREERRAAQEARARHSPHVEEVRRLLGGEIQEIHLVDAGDGPP